MISSLDAHKYLQASMTACSHRAGWRSLLLRAYDDPPQVEPFTTPATMDHLVVLVTRGSCNVSGLYRGKWQGATYTEGSIGMTAPAEQVTLRWHGSTPHSTIQLHIPAQTLHSCAEELLGPGSSAPRLPNDLAYEDPLLQRVILGVDTAMRQGAPDIYADSAAHFLTMHLLVRHADCRARPAPARDAVRMQRVYDYMRDHLGDDVALDDLARVACVSRFHLIRLFKQAYGETPYQRLMRLRVDAVCRRLESSSQPISTIAAECGFANPAHLAASFRRMVGVSPTAYRQQRSR